jgi:hypothetical protein
MGSDRTERNLGFADLMSIGVLSVSVLLLVSLKSAANPIILCIAIAIVCGIVLVVGEILAELAIYHNQHEEKYYTKNRETRL